MFWFLVTLCIAAWLFFLADVPPYVGDESEDPDAWWQ